MTNAVTFALAGVERHDLLSRESVQGHSALLCATLVTLIFFFLLHAHTHIYTYMRKHTYYYDRYD